MCYECALKHADDKLAEKHDVTYLGLKLALADGTCALQCAKHSGSKADLYCSDCYATFCVACVSQHSGHKLPV